MRANSNVLMLMFLAFTSFAVYSQDTCVVLKDGIKDKYLGECKNGLAHGYGEAEGYDKYIGLFRKGYPNGDGIYSWNSGEVYDGKWKRGVRHGEGKYYFFSNGRDTVLIGKWENDEYVGITSDRPYGVEYRNNIGRVTFTKINNEGRYIRLKFIRNGGESSNISDLLLFGSSGNENDSRLFSAFENAEFPFNSKVQFTAPNLFHTGSLRCEVRFFIMEPGAWNVSITY